MPLYPVHPNCGTPRIHQDGTLLTSPEQQDANIKLAPFTVDAGKWGDFLCTVFDEWLKEDVGNYYIQLFDSTLANWVSEQPGVCTLARTCGHAGVMEFNGDVYACDHFVFPEYKLGNIQTKDINGDDVQSGTTKVWNG